MPTVRRVLEACLLQDNDDFWVQNPPDLKNCVPDAGRRNQQAMQVYLRLYMLVASKGQPCCCGSTDHGPTPLRRGVHTVADLHHLGTGLAALEMGHLG